MIALSALVLPLALSATPAAAWSEHARLSRAALAQVPGLDAAVPAETLDQYAAAQGQSRDELLSRLGLNARADYGFKAGERPGAPVDLRSILAAYADEPDRGLDEDQATERPVPLFSDSDVKSMERLHAGDASKAVRHVYWPGGILGTRFQSEFAGTVVDAELRRMYPDVPLEGPYGEAPQRCRALAAASAAAFRAGHPYWGARFLSWATHYAQDLTQPLHTGAVASAHFLCWGRPRDIRGCSLRLGSYYHLGFERVALLALKGELGGTMARALEDALSAAAPAPDAGDAGELARRAAEQTHRDMGETGRVLWEILPRLGDPLSEDPTAAAGSPEFARAVVKAAAEDPRAAAELQALLTGLFRRAGEVTRALAAQAARPAVARRPAAAAPPAGFHAWLAAQARALQSP